MSSAYLEGIDRNQQFLLPECVDDYIAPEHPVRIIDAFAERMASDPGSGALPLREMGEEGGRKGYHPAVMARLFIWGYVNRVRSTRRLEEDCGRNLELIWLLGKQQPDHSSISRFRKANTKSIKLWLREFNLVCANLGLFGGEELAVDGVFLKAVNSKSNNHTQEKIRRSLERIDERISNYLTELEASEQEQEESQGKEIEGLREKLAQLDEAREQARELLKQAEASPSGQVSLIDSDSRLLNKKSVPGAAIVGMLGEVAVDGKEHLIAGVKVVGAGNDLGQLAPMAEAAREVLPAPSETETTGESKAPRLLADGGYFKIDDLAKCEEQGWEVFVPPYPERKNRAGMYPVSEFIYDKESDTYCCPAGKTLHRHGNYTKGSATYWTYYDTQACRECPFKDQCTGSAYRKIHRHENEATVARMRERLSASPEMYRRRAAIVEHPLGSMMFWNEGRNLLCRGIELANAELSMSALAYNFKRAVKVAGLQKLLAAMI